MEILIRKDKDENHFVKKNFSKSYLSKSSNFPKIAVKSILDGYNYSRTIYSCSPTHSYPYLWASKITS